MNKITSSAKYLFETSWEVCNKVGGIYTVVKSKAELMQENYENYFLIGPYFKDKANTDMEEKEAPEFLKTVFAEMQDMGVKCYFGSWNIKGEPNVILVEPHSLKDRADEIKKELWENYQIDTLFSNWDFIEPMIWSYSIGIMMEKIQKVLSETTHETKIAGHFHEWMSGFAGLYLKQRNIPVATTFTTHATMLGRSIAGSGGDLYSMLDNINPEEEARRVGVMDKFTTERACAHNLDVFTTVSEITGIEAEKLLGKKPDVLVLNGLDIGKFPTIEETSILHAEKRDKIREFLAYTFHPYYNFDLKKNLIFYVVGRYEYKNKGLDIMTRALGKLNDRLKAEGSDRTISVFYWIPGDSKGIRKELLENKTFYRHIKNYVHRHMHEIEENIITSILDQKTPTSEEVFTKEFLRDTKMYTQKFKKEGNPPLATHYLGNENDDAILNGFKSNGLLNREEDKVKVLLYPVYLNGVDGLIDVNYYDALVGCHLGIFASYYEPWGYTPLESAALGVPAITTDLAGFGRFIKKDPKVDKSGLFVLQRYEKSDDEAVDEFTEVMYNYAKLSRHKRVENKVDAKELAELADWKELISNYIAAHDLAIKRRGL